MLEKISNFWSEYNFYIIIGVLLLILIGIGLFNKAKGKSGTWNKDMFNSLRNKTNTNNFVPGNAYYPTKPDSRGETECRRVLEKIFGRPFSKARPDWLNNTVTSNNLELDCYNHDLRLACEYQGEQHYKFNKFFHRNKDDFMNGKYRDDMKRRICRDNGVILIEVPYTVKIPNIEWYIKGKIASLKI